MQKRFMAIWFRHLLTDGLARRRPELKDLPFVLAAPQKNRIVITASSLLAEREGAFTGMAVADARAAVNNLLVIDEIPGQAHKLLRLLGLGCIRYTPIVSIYLPDKLILNISGCAHLWGGEREYLKEVVLKLRAAGFDARAAIADTPGAAWAVARLRKSGLLCPKVGKQRLSLLYRRQPYALNLK